MRSRAAIVAAIAWAVFSQPSYALGGQAAKEIARAAGFDIYTATRKDTNLYELFEGFIIITKYCYVYTYSSEVVILIRNQYDKKIVFLSDDNVCQIDAIYKK
ncbi:MAG: hypothetical protein AB7U35_04300 [Sphingobium sp.]